MCANVQCASIILRLLVGLLKFTEHNIQIHNQHYNTNVQIILYFSHWTTINDLYQLFICLPQTT